MFPLVIALSQLKQWAEKASHDKEKDHVCGNDHVAYQNTLPDHFWIKLHAKIQVVGRAAKSAPKCNVPRVYWGSLVIFLPTKCTKRKRLIAYYSFQKQNLWHNITMWSLLLCVEFRCSWWECVHSMLDNDSAAGLCATDNVLATVLYACDHKLWLMLWT